MAPPSRRPTRRRSRGIVLPGSSAILPPPRSTPTRSRSMRAAASKRLLTPGNERRRSSRHGVIIAATALAASSMTAAASLNAQDVSSTSTSIPQQYIIGGTNIPAPHTRYPYLVSLGQTRSADHTCAATLIAPDILLSAAHCKGSFTWATLGMYDRFDPDEEVHGDDGRQYIKIDVENEANTVVHPSYRWTRTNPDIDYDYLLIKLSSPADITRFPPVKLNRNPSVPSYDDQKLTIAGWGTTDPTGQVLSQTLRHGTVGYVTKSTCDESDGFISGTYYSYRGFLTNSMMCAWSENVDACLGDSGGPLLIADGGDEDDADGVGEDVQVGIVSFGVGCNSPDFPGLYSRISDQIGWIDEVVCELSDDPPDDFGCDKGDDDEEEVEVVPVATPKPTRRPTARPMRRPTRRPTPRPTPRPTRRPTRRPTPSPSARPVPVNEPTKQSVLDFLLGGTPSSQEEEEESKPTSSPPTDEPTASFVEPINDPTLEPTAESLDWGDRRTEKPTIDIDLYFVGEDETSSGVGKRNETLLISIGCASMAALLVIMLM